MAQQEITGWTKEEYLEQKAKHPDSHEYRFEDFYCLCKIAYQPEDYEGPERYCKKYTLLKDEDEEGDRESFCRNHIGKSNGWQKGKEVIEEEGHNFDENHAKSLKHGMYAEDENLKENWSEADQTVYDQVMSWAEDFGFEEGSPAHMQLESLAMSKVRELRSEKYLNENGEVVEREQWNPETEQVEEWEEVHQLADHLRLKKKTILSMMKELGLTPKAQSQIGESDAKADEASAIAEITSEALDSEDEEYDPEKF